ncbi:MAG: Na(+)-translocating NADH-quinone reductase subunit A [Prevotella sp.]|nr:Na(+)-translocating NADH-quinone reductase subunit A [Prevotella sp.]MCM1075683.1 Na(+)-translocating NADH-quinone reductase subunit A [Ruminococcus sp.]
MADIIKIKKGLDIPMPGVASAEYTDDSVSYLFGIVPDDFPGHKWKSAVKVGDRVFVGSPLLYSKEKEKVKLVSPVCGIVQEIRRGERRHIMALTVEASKAGGVPAEEDFFLFGNGNSPEIKCTDRESILDILCEAGLFAMMRQRPFDIVPDPDIVPRDIFVTGFDTAPLAPVLITRDMYAMHEKGLEILSRLTSGRVFLSVPYDSDLSSNVATITEFDGPHPAGNVGVQISKIKPVNKGETVWTLDSRTVVRIGKLFSTRKLDSAASVCVCGEMAVNPHYINTRIGVSLQFLLAGQISQDKGHVRAISGNVLTGVKADPASDFLRFPYRQITLIAEGDHTDEFMGWATVSPTHFSVKRTFPSFLLGKRGHYKFDSRLRGGRRAMILSGEMEKVFPMDIYPEFLLKAIMSGNIEKMEQLGIYEVAPEDFALPEFVDTSKQPLQQIVRTGLDKLREELS